MRVKYLIEQLKEYNPDDEIIAAYWDRDHVAINLNRDINDGQWAEIAAATTKAIDNLDWWATTPPLPLPSMPSTTTTRKH
jgi:hypothetical protein